MPAGTFYRSYDGVTFTDQGFPATISAFRLDTYEVTVGRFREFVAAYSQGMIPAGAGRNPNDPTDPGWDVSWNAMLPADSAALRSALDCDTVFPTWTDDPGVYENRPMNCINWYEAFAFCIWDGGRLPTEAEWNYAAAGGSEQRLYPWGSDAPDCTYANFRGASGGTEVCVAPPDGATNDVGSESPKGDGKWGQADMAGNLWEWVLDWYASPYPLPCVDCADTTPGSTPAGNARAMRGGDYNTAVGFLPAARRDGNPQPEFNYLERGARCARSPK